MMGEPLCICFGMKEYCCKCFGEPVSVLGELGSKGGKLELDSAYRGRGGLRHTEAPWHVPQNYKVGRHILKLISISFTQRMLYACCLPRRHYLKTISIFFYNFESLFISPSRHIEIPSRDSSRPTILKIVFITFI